MLERFRVAKQREIALLETMAVAGALPLPYGGQRIPFIDSLRAKTPKAIIAEYKRASPSRGDINLGLEPEAVAEAYGVAGAGAISVLTEEDYFKGNIAFLERMVGPGLPLLRKDFILHPLQIEHTAATPASAVLLIVRMLKGALLAQLLASCRQHGLEAVVEVCDRSDLHRAQEAGAEIIQVNNRDLDVLKVDLDVSKRLVTHKQTGEFWITASGIDTSAQLEALLDLGFDAALIGSSLMSGSQPGQSLAALLGKEKSYG